MNDQAQWPLQKIRDAYLDVLDLYNNLFPLRPERKSEREEEPNFFDLEEDPTISAVAARVDDIGPKLEEAADPSENCQIWRSGESLQGLNQGMKDRIEKALKFGA